MPRPPKRKRSESRTAPIVQIVAAIPLLALRLFLAYLRLKWRSKRSSVRFARDLRRAGMSRARAQKLADDYGSALSLRRILKATRALRKA